jgi:hypothetical protein
VKAANLVLRFLLEIGALVAVGYWGWETGGWVLAVGALAAFITVWALLVSPKHTIETSRQVSLAIELALWVATGAALHATDHGLLALAFATVSVISGLLNYVWR